MKYMEHIFGKYFTRVVYKLSRKTETDGTLKLMAAFTEAFNVILPKI
jgi:hypothetical protein